MLKTLFNYIFENLSAEIHNFSLWIPVFIASGIGCYFYLYEEPKSWLVYMICLFWFSLMREILLIKLKNIRRFLPGPLWNIFWKRYWSLLSFCSVFLCWGILLCFYWLVVGFIQCLSIQSFWSILLCFMIMLWWRIF